MAQADGSVVIEANLDVSKAEKKLAKLKSNIEKTESSIQEMEAKKSPLTQQADELNQKLKAAQAEVQRYGQQWAAGVAGADKMQSDAISKVSQTRAEYEKVVEEIDKIDRKLLPAHDRLDGMKVQAGELVKKIEEENAAQENYLRSLRESATVSNQHIADLNQELAKLKARLKELEKAGLGLGYEEYDKISEKIKSINAELKEYRDHLGEADSGPLQPLRNSAEIADQRIVDLNQELARLKVRLEELKSEDVGLGYTEYDQTAQRIQEINAELREYQKNLGAVSEETEEAAYRTGYLASSINDVRGRMEKLSSRIAGLVKRVLFFSVITMALRSMRTWLGKVIKTNDEASAAIAKLKGALLTLAQPLVNIVIPALVTLVNLLTRVISMAAEVVSKLFGTTAAQSAEAAKALYDQTEALDGVGSAASDASKSLAGFDEINQLSGQTAAGGAAASEISPDFSLDLGMEDEQLDNILGLVKAIAIALAAWKISSALGGGLTNTLGSLMFIAGAVQFVTSLFDAWSNSVSWDNLQGSIFGLTLAVSGLYVLFGPTAAAIGAIVGGLAMLVTGFKDAGENGWNLKNMFMSIAGLLATGIGIGALTGSFIPALIGGIASLLLAITVATGHGEELLFGVRQALAGFLKFFKGIFTGDMELAMSGIADIFGGLKTAANAVLSGIEDFFLSFFDWLDEKTGGRLHGILMFMKGLFSGVFEEVRNVVGNTFDAIQQIFGGFLTFISGVFTGDFDKAWEGVKEIFRGVWNGIVGILESAVNLIIRGINWLISKLNTIHFDIPEWVPLIGGKSFGINIQPIGEFQIPRLATGAVIPPNREFLAVLGDQKSGTNIEAPLSTIEQAVENVLARRGFSGGGEQTVILQVDRRELGRVVYKLNNEESRRIGVTLTGV